jgi:bifunctional non-homologous end joining protein LigD
MKVHPFTPMSPILTGSLPEGEEWIYQLKWDGFRIIAWVDQGKVELYSKKMLPKNSKYPDLVHALSRMEGTFLLDGEAFILDAKTGKPSFQKMQQRDKLSDAAQIRRAAERNPVQYVMFDLLQTGDTDLRKMPFRSRYEALGQLSAVWEAPFYAADTFEDGHALWHWVETNGWEGVIAKRWSSVYREGKEHKDWFKRKTELRTDAEAVGVLIKEGRISSLAMRRNGVYFGRVSSGLDGKAKAELDLLEAGMEMEHYFAVLPEGLRGTEIRWLRSPLPIVVTGREITDAGMLRHPKLLSMGEMTL